MSRSSVMENFRPGCWLDYGITGLSIGRCSKGAPTEDVFNPVYFSEDDAISSVFS